MPATTTRLALPYPTPDDDVDVPSDVQALADKLDSVVAIPDAGDLKFSARTAEHGNWAKADGRALTAGMYPVLRAALVADGSPYGNTAGDPKIPDMRGRAPVGAGTGAGLTARANGQAGGTETHTLTEAQLAAHDHTGQTNAETTDHTHGVRVASAPGSTTTNVAPGSTSYSGVANQSQGRSLSHVHTFATADAGGGQAHPNMPPFTVGTWFIYAV